MTEAEGRQLIERLVEAINRHDADAIAELFDPDLRSELPAHPARNYVGRERLRANWSLIFELVPNLEAELTRCTVDADLVWAEWSWTGTQRDGSRFERTGVVLHGIEHGAIRWVRTYMQPILSTPESPGERTLRDMGLDPRGR